MSSIYSSFPPKLLVDGNQDIDKSSETFWMYQHKIRRCFAYKTRPGNPQWRKCDWKTCPCGHPGDIGRRRNPQQFHYSSEWCVDFQIHKQCPRGNKCKFAHGFNEYWFHPSRFRTQWCRYGRWNCKNHSCPFAHTRKQIRSMIPTSEEERDWENLNQDCLVEIFQKIKVEELIYVIPFVCKSWFKASLIPDCWKFLDFQTFPRLPFDTPHIDRLIQASVSRSCGTAIGVSLPSHCTFNVVNYIANNCPALRFFDMSAIWGVEKEQESMIQMICNWKHLEILSLVPVGDAFEKLLSQITIHCKKFVMLNAYAVFDREYVSAIVNILPKIKCLGLKGCWLDSNMLKIILTGCKELEFLDVSSTSCRPIKKEDNEMLWKMLSHIKKVDLRGFTFEECRKNLFYA